LELNPAQHGPEAPGRLPIGIADQGDPARVQVHRDELGQGPVIPLFIENVRGEDPVKTTQVRVAPPVHEAGPDRIEAIAPGIRVDKVKGMLVIIGGQNVPSDRAGHDGCKSQAAAEIERRTHPTRLILHDVLRQHDRRRPELPPVRHVLVRLKPGLNVRIVEQSVLVGGTKDLDRPVGNDHAPASARKSGYLWSHAAFTLARCHTEPDPYSTAAGAKFEAFPGWSLWKLPPANYYMGPLEPSSILAWVCTDRTGPVAKTQATYQLKPFHRLYAGLVAGWVRNDDELFWLAPHTPPAISPEKVLEWTVQRGRPRLLWSSPWPDPTGYAELNDLPSRPGELWIGHFIISPERRGTGLGARMLRALLAEAFGTLNAQRVALIVFPENEPAIRCYRANGLRVTAYQDKTFTTRPGIYRMLEMAIDRSAYRPAPNGS
jgi:RimJ/RimL family protein N-acetyltransferase